jgi:segregation and condensation protein B
MILIAKRRSDYPFAAIVSAASAAAASNQRQSGIPQMPSSSESPLSLERLRQAFAAMLGQPVTSNPNSMDAASDSTSDDSFATRLDLSPAPIDCDAFEISPRSLVEAMLFVGRPDGGAVTAREMAAVMRDVSPREVDAVVAELRKIYDQDGAPYEIMSTAEGYRLQLREKFSSVRDKFHGRVRETKLSPSAIEVLSIVAYHQPVTACEIDELRRAPGGRLLAMLVRRGLVRVEHSDNTPQTRHYVTTERFLRIFNLRSIEELPRTRDFEAA